MQIKINDGTQEKRFTMPEYFVIAMNLLKTQTTMWSCNVNGKITGCAMENWRLLVQEVMDELVAAYPQERIEQLVEMESRGQIRLAYNDGKVKLTMDMLNDESWEKRYQALSKWKIQRLTILHY